MTLEYNDGNWDVYIVFDKRIYKQDATNSNTIVYREVQ
jgi:hypothetical protein